MVMSRPALLLVSVIVIIASAAIVGWSFFGLGTSPTPQANKQVGKQATQSGKPVAKGFPAVPVSLANPAVKYAQVKYTFKGTIKEVKPDPKGLLIITDAKGSKVPKFIVTPTTKVTIDTNGQKKEGSSSDLAVNQKVEIVVAYGLKKKAWNDVSSITIFLGSQSTPTKTP